MYIDESVSAEYHVNLVEYVECIKGIPYIILYKVMNSLAPNCLCKYFTELSDRNITCGNTRGLLDIPKKQLACG